MNQPEFSDSYRWDHEPSLWNAFRAGHRKAFEHIYATHIQSLINYGYKISGDRNVIQDEIQDLFVELWESREKLAPVKSIKYYLLKSLRYKIIRHIRSGNNEQIDQTYEFHAEDYEHHLIEVEQSVQQSTKLRAALDSLPKRQKEAIYLRYFEELSNEQVAEVMGVNYQSACKFIYTALRKLKDVMLLILALFQV